MNLYHGDILYTDDTGALCTHPDSYIAVEGGIVEGIYKTLPERFAALSVTDYGRRLIIPAFSDLHVHASQYTQRGVGMDLLLSDWLNQYTFPQEANFRDPDYAEPIYEAFVNDMVRHGTFHANIFTTIHRKTASLLMNKLEQRGLYGLVGKVNMDFASPKYLCETAEESLRETEHFLEENAGNRTARPILTPRFAPTCSRPLLEGLGRLGKKYQVGVHTHLVESLWEAAESVRLYPDCSCDAEIYEKTGLLGNGPSIFAHYIFPSEDDIRIAKQYGAVTVHCPDATNNVIAGIMPSAQVQSREIPVALGTDIGAGHGVAVYRQIARAVQLSKLKEFYEPEGNRTLTLAEAFHMATRVGGSVFGKFGSLEPGYHFHALVIDHMEDPGHPMTPEQRLERFCYIGDDRNITARYLGEALL